MKTCLLSVCCACEVIKGLVTTANTAIVIKKNNSRTTQRWIGGLVLIGLLCSSLGKASPWGTTYTMDLNGLVFGSTSTILENHSGTVSFDSPLISEVVPGDPLPTGIDFQQNGGLLVREATTLNLDGGETISIDVWGAQESQFASAIFDNRLFDPITHQPAQPVVFDVTGLYWVGGSVAQISNISLSATYIDPSFNRVLDPSTDYSLFVSGSGTSVDPLSLHFDIDPLVFQDYEMALYNAIILRLEFAVHDTESNADGEITTASVYTTKECSRCPVDQSLTLTWDTGVGEILGYRVFLGDTETTATELVADVFTGSVTFNTYNDLGLQSGDSVCFRVKAYSLTGESDYSSAVCGSL